MCFCRIYCGTLQNLAARQTTHISRTSTWCHFRAWMSNLRSFLPLQRWLVSLFNDQIVCTPTTSSMGNISVFEGQGVWNVCLRCPHLRDRSGLCQVGYFCDHGKRHLCIWILPGRPIKMMKRLPHWKIQIQLSKHLQIQIQISSGLMQINNQTASQQNRVADDGGKEAGATVPPGKFSSINLFLPFS